LEEIFIERVGGQADALVFRSRTSWLVARREYLERVRAKSFLIMTILIPLLMGGLVVSCIFEPEPGFCGAPGGVTDNPQFATDCRRR